MNDTLIGFDIKVQMEPSVLATVVAGVVLVVVVVDVVDVEEVVVSSLDVEVLVEAALDVLVATLVAPVNGWTYP